MNTLKELIYYCNIIEPVGALLLTGEWGCGKTYLIENGLKKAVMDKIIVIRISLFGLSSIGEINSVVKQSWLTEYFNQKNLRHIGKMKRGKEILNKLEFLPEPIKKLANTDWMAFVKISPQINEKNVVLVFDDLERSNLDIIEIMGVINNYCENQKFHVIVVANQEKIENKKEDVLLTAKIEQLDGNISKEQKKEITIKSNHIKEGKNFSYKEIKEKIIQRTVAYIPEYTEIVRSVVESMTYQDENYRKFVLKCERRLIDLFANDNDKNYNIKHFHNIRSLKCGISDFYRLYQKLSENNFDNIDKWFYSFVSFTIAYKAGIVKDEIFIDEEIKLNFPIYMSQYMMSSAKNWILNGIWDEEMVKWEIEQIKAREKAQSPTDVVKHKKICDIDEDIILLGFPDVLEMAYEGTLNLDEYVLFIENSCWARKMEYELPTTINWEKVRQGIRICLDKLLEQNAEGQQRHSMISKGNRDFFTEEEWKTYLTIENFDSENILVFSNNKKLYIDTIKENVLLTFVICQNRSFNVFDEDMAVITATAYISADNCVKRNLVRDFYNMWKSNILSPDFTKIEESISGFNKLKSMLIEEKENLTKNNKTISIYHTNDFIEKLNDLINKLKCSNATSLTN